MTLEDSKASIETAQKIANLQFAYLDRFGESKLKGWEQADYDQEMERECRRLKIPGNILCGSRLRTFNKRYLAKFLDMIKKQAWEQHENKIRRKIEKEQGN